MRKASDKTMLNTLRRNYRKLVSEHSELKTECAKYRARATVAEQALAEWKERFDRLLKVHSESRSPETTEAGER